MASIRVTSSSKLLCHARDGVCGSNGSFEMAYDHSYRVCSECEYSVTDKNGDAYSYIFFDKRACFHEQVPYPESYLFVIEDQISEDKHKLKYSCAKGSESGTGHFHARKAEFTEDQAVVHAQIDGKCTYRNEERIEHLSDAP